MEATFTLEKETKNTYRFQEDESSGRRKLEPFMSRNGALTLRLGGSKSRSRCWNNCQGPYLPCGVMVMRP